MWSCWKMKFQMRMNIHIQESVSDNHYKIFVMRKLLKVWNNAILMNRKQKEMKSKMSKSNQIYKSCFYSICCWPLSFCVSSQVFETLVSINM